MPAEGIDRESVRTRDHTQKIASGKADSIRSKNAGTQHFSVDGDNNTVSLKSRLIIDMEWIPWRNDGDGVLGTAACGEQ